MAPELSYFSRLRREVYSVDRLSLLLLQSLSRRPSKRSLLRSVDLIGEISDPPEEVSLVTLILEGAAKGERVPISDVQHVLEALHTRKDELVNILKHRYGRFMPVDVATHKEFVHQLHESVGVPEGPVRLVSLVIDERPGLPIVDVHRIAERKMGSMSYSTVHKSVNRLENEGVIVTMGGPQGRHRYCFPNPARMASWKKLYGTVQVVRIKLQANLSDAFETIAGPLKDVFISNGSHPTFIVTRFAMLKETPREVKCIGRLHEPSGEEMRRIGLRASADFPPVHGFMEAARITTPEVTSTKARELYRDNELIKELGALTRG